MPRGKKICPKCQSEFGVRTKKCSECGHEFYKTRKKTSAGIFDDDDPPVGSKIGKVKISKNNHPVSDELVAVGMWVYDRTDDMPPIRVPDEVFDGKVDNQTVYDNICYHGLGDCLWYLIDSGQIKDVELRKKWKKCSDTMREIWKYLINCKDIPKNKR